MSMTLIGIIREGRNPHDTGKPGWYLEAVENQPLGREFLQGKRVTLQPTDDMADVRLRDEKDKKAFVTGVLGGCECMRCLQELPFTVTDVRSDFPMEPFTQ